MMTTHQNTIRIGADVGGTFTDVVLIDARGNIWTHKVPSTPPNFEQAVLNAIAHLLHTTDALGTAVSEVAHGTTVATNAVLEQRGAKTALITTKGFRDVLELRRIRAPQMYDLFFEKPQALIERYLRFELTERISASGEVLTSLSEPELWRLKEALEKEAVESVAVCTLHAYAFPQHENAVGDFLRAHLPEVSVSLSSEVLPERKEYERTATTVVNAYVRPVMQRYLNAMRSGLQTMGIEAPLLMMQSAGGLTPEADAARLPVFVLESGPAAGVLAAGFTAQRLGTDNLITLDMGGTTAKASMIEDGAVAYSPEYEVGASISAGNRLVGGGGELIRAPSIDIAEVGSGGGSIAYLDGAGGLRVGPRSAGAVPGPACYQRGGTEPTITDANVVLGYIRPGELADGEVSINIEAARRAIYDRIAAPLGMDLLQAAEGVHRIANAHTMRALRAVSTERGRDPREFVLMAFGGSGPIHAAGLARELLIRQIIVPPLPGLFSTLGLLFSGVEHHDVRSCLLSGETLNATALEQIKTEMQRNMLAQFETEGYPADQVTLSCSVDIRFKGQASEIRIPVADENFAENTVQTLYTTFETEHERLYGHRSDPDNPVEVVAVRLIGQAGIRGQQGVLNPAERLGERALSRVAYFGTSRGTINTPVISRHEMTRYERSTLLGSTDHGKQRRLVPGHEEGIIGPLLIDEYDSTIVVPPDYRGYLDSQGNILMSPVTE